MGWLIEKERPFTLGVRMGDGRINSRIGEDRDKHYNTTYYQCKYIKDDGKRLVSSFMKSM